MVVSMVRRDVVMPLPARPAYVFTPYLYAFLQLYRLLFIQPSTYRQLTPADDIAIVFIIHLQGHPGKVVPVARFPCCPLQQGLVH